MSLGNLRDGRRLHVETQPPRDMQPGHDATGIRVGIVAPSEEAFRTVRGCVEATGLAEVVLEVRQHDIEQGDRALRNLRQQSLDIVLLDIEGLASELVSVRRVHAALEEAWIFVGADNADSSFVIDTMRAGAREFLPKPLEARAVSDAIERYAAEQQKKSASEVLGELLCVIGAKGGCGATSLTINLGASLAKAPDAKVALIDLNRPLGDLAVNLNLKPPYSMIEVQTSASRIDSVLVESFMCRAYGMSVLSSKREFVDDHLSDPESLERMVEVTRQGYTHVVADLLADPRGCGFKNLVEEASSLILPVTPELPAIWRTKRLLASLRSLSVSDKVKVVLMRWQKTDEITPEDIERALDRPVFWKMPYQYESSLHAINAGSPHAHLTRSKLDKSYREFAAAMTGLTPAKKKLGFLGL